MNKHVNKNKKPYKKPVSPENSDTIGNRKSRRQKQVSQFKLKEIRVQREIMDQKAQGRKIQLKKIEDRKKAKEVK